MQAQSTAAPTPLRPSRSGVLAVSGWGVGIKVERHRLIVTEGHGPRRREAMLFRATSGLKRLVVIGRAGTISLAALGWLRDVGASFAHLDHDGEILLISAPWGNDDGRLRRAQALSVTNGVALKAARGIVMEKLGGQRNLLTRVEATEEAQATIDGAISSLPGCRDSSQLMRVEAEGAGAYWAALAPERLTFARKDLPGVPAHWLTLGSRSSPLTSSPRRAATPGQALLNVAYGSAQAEAVIACAKIGLDSALGILHADTRRDSLALDLLEVCRPAVDSKILELIRSTTFAARDFREDRQGQVWVSPSLARTIAEWSPLWARELAPVAERLAKRFAQGAGSGLRVPDLLTNTARSAAKDGVRSGSKRVPAVLLPSPRRACRACGVVLGTPSPRRYCPDCLPERRAEHAQDFVPAGPAALARMRAEGSDPLQRPETKEKLRQARLRRLTEKRASKHAGAEDVDPEVFKQEIFPTLQAISVRRMAAATGLSRPYCSEIRRGLKVPHPGHWEALKTAAASSSP
jgi:CRISP-associated protein Cas1